MKKQNDYLRGRYFVFFRVPETCKLHEKDVDNITHLSRLADDASMYSDKGFDVPLFAMKILHLGGRKYCLQTELRFQL